jgi:hypothetical protein
MSQILRYETGSGGPNVLMTGIDGLMKGWVYVVSIDGVFYSLQGGAKFILQGLNVIARSNPQETN